MISIIAPFVLSTVFAGACALAYLKLAKGRKNVRRESLLVFVALLVFVLLRLLTLEP